MITAMHALMYADDPVAAREFLRDVLGLEHVDAGDGWLIFKTGPSELGVHPAGGEGWNVGPRHEISLICDDIERTVIELRDRGAKFAHDVQDRGFGLVATLTVPGAGDVLLYQPRHPTAYSE